VGVLGGTFDPVHLGHLRAAEEFAELAHLDEVLLIPAARPPHRPLPAAPAEERLAMVRLAVRDNPRLSACDLEVRRGGTSYTVETLGELVRSRPGLALALAMGADAFRDIALWRGYQEIAALADIWVLSRPGDPLPDPLAPLPPALRGAYRREGDILSHPAGTTLREAAVTALDIRSSDIRAAASAGRSIRYLVTDAVLDYIRGHRLYLPGPAGEKGMGG
jgi:nicotinate-nucleotide adenylyltransferase